MAQALIDLRDHEHNLCKAARLVWDRRQSDGFCSVYSVKAGFIAVLPNLKAFAETFTTQDAAVSAIGSFLAEAR